MEWAESMHYLIEGGIFVIALMGAFLGFRYKVNGLAKDMARLGDTIKDKRDDDKTFRKEIREELGALKINLAVIKALCPLCKGVEVREGT